MLFAEIDMIAWDIRVFSETLASTASAILDGGHIFDTAHKKNAKVASGVGILVHVKHVCAVIVIYRCSDRVIAIDSKFGQLSIRMISVCMPRLGYS